MPEESQSKSKVWFIIGGVVLLIILLIGAYSVWARGQTRQTTSEATSSFGTSTAATKSDANSDVTWSYSGSTWVSSATPPSCPDPLMSNSPADVSMATAILYPGQIRGGQYKPHGGFRFDGKANSDITVKAPFDATITRASRYIEQGETQYLIELVNACGMMYRFDHLLTLSDVMQTMADALPAAQVDDSRTTNVSGVRVKAGEVMATAVGFEKTKNVGFDFGLYDLSKKNQASTDATWFTQHKNDAELAAYAVCWLNLLPSGDAAIAKKLPGGDATAGTKSDYCK